MNIIIGNPALRPSFTHQLSFDSRYMKLPSFRMTSVSLSARFQQNAFTQLSTVKNAVVTTQTINTNGFYDYTLSGSYSKIVKKISVAINPLINLGQTANFMAGPAGQSLKNKSRTQLYRLGFSASRFKAKKYQLHLMPGIDYTITNATLNKMANMEYWSFSGTGSLELILPAGLVLSNKVFVSLREKDPRFPADNNFVFWDADLAKYLFKEKLQLKLSAKDILAERNGYSRNFSNTSFTESYTTLLQRYFLISLVWNFRKMGAGAGSPAGPGQNSPIIRIN